LHLALKLRLVVVDFGSDTRLRREKSYRLITRLPRGTNYLLLDA
jgi:hypothetical protein